MAQSEKENIERIESQSPDLKEVLFTQLRSVVPEAFSDGELDADKLKALLGEKGDAGPERYTFSWAGKRDAIAMLQVPTRATLAPDRDKSVNFEEAQHVFIEGENLEVLKVLYRSYFGRVKMIYIDPPYNTGNDFIYPDDFADPLDNYLRITGQKIDDGNYTTSQVDKSGRIHSAWLSMMYPRLAVARQLLSDEGLLFASIDDHELHNLRLVLDSIFGEENFVAQFVWKSRQSEDTRAKTGVSSDHEYILCYRRSNEAVLRGTEKDLQKFSNPDNDPRGEWRSADLTGLATKEQRPNLHYDLINPETGIEYECPPKGWRFDRKKMSKKIAESRILWPPDPTGRPRHKLFVSEMRSLFKNVSSVITDITTADGTRETNQMLGDGVFPFPKPSALLEMLLEQTTEEDDIVLDFFAGSSPMGQAVLALNNANGGGRRFILVQLPERTTEGSNARKAGLKTIADIGRARLFASLRDPEIAGTADIGFRAYKLVASNMRSWSGVTEKDAVAFAAQIEAFADSLAPGWKPENVIWEVALREGYSLSSRTEKITNTGKNAFWRVTDPDREQSFVICLDDTLTLEAVRALSLPKNALFICRDTALDDTLSANLALQCRLKVL